MRVGVSQRHVSFVESGRARPSRELLMAWLQALALPLAVRNEAMLDAGYAPEFGGAPLDDPALAQAKDAMIHLLRAHDPMPALLLDAEWNLVDWNRGGRWLASVLMPGAADLPAGVPINVLDLLVHPEGFAKHMVNLREVGPALLAHLRESASVQPSLTPRVEAFAAMLEARVGRQARHAGVSRSAPPVLTARYATPYGELSFFSMFTTFGTPQDITLASLRVEHLFPADEATRAVVKARVE